jgi:FkbM family methyltransferase
MLIACLRSLKRRLLKILAYAHVVSWADAIRLTGTPANRETDLFLRRLNRHVTIRPGTSDFYCFNKVFLDEEYAVPFDTNPRLIIDAGANIGLATLYLSARFPQAKVIAIEPEPSNYELLVRNCSGLTNVTAWHAAVWNNDTSLQIQNPNAEKWAFTVTPCTRDAASAITALTIPQILARSGHDKIDILKLDIEGAERELFCNGCEAWLPYVAMIIIELHDRFLPGCSRAVYSKLCQMPFHQEIRGENLFILLGSDDE